MKTKEVIERVMGLDLSKYPFNEIKTLINEFDSYPYKSFVNDLQKARISSAKYQYECCLPGCKQKALKHSHIIPQCVLKKYICKSKHKLLQNVIDEIHPMSVRDTGELPLDKFQTLGIEQAMSMPIFCKEHDNGLFDVYEKNADSIEPEDRKFQVLQSLRAIGALRLQNLKLLVENNVKQGLNDFYKGGVFDEELEGCKYLLRRQDASITRLYESICNDDFNHYYFTCIELNYIGLAVCDALVDEGDLAMYCESDVYSEPLKILYVHLLPKGNHSYLILGYDTRSVADQQKMQLVNWAKALDKRTDLKVIYDILCHCSNNWCISPDCDEKIIQYLEQNYSSDKMDVMLGECLDIIHFE